MLKRLVHFVYFAALAVVLVSGGGWLYLKRYETPAPVAEPSEIAAVAGIALVAVLIAVVAGGWLCYRRMRRFALGNLTFLILSLLTLLLCEGMARLVAPPWPAVGLDGYVPHSEASRRGRRIEIEEESIARGVGTNDWGQRDLKRTIAPAPGTHRIGFVGDSFLDESTPVPLSVRTEQKLQAGVSQGRPPQSQVEIINLGVTGSSPDEYYYRLKNIGIPLGIDECVMFVFAGNDLNTAPRTLRTFGGVAAVYPRGSLLAACHLYGLNHVLTNRYRPLFQNRNHHVRMSELENQMRDELKNRNDEDAARFLFSIIERIRMGTIGYFPAEQAARLQERLTSPEMASVYAMARNPDRGLFEDYYLGTGMDAASDPSKVWDPMYATTAFHWVKKSFDLCRSRGIGMILVIIPEGCQVDSRMYAQWKPLTDFRRVTRSSRVAAQALAAQARAIRIPVLDLHVVLQDIPGTYLNLDGHWSDQGVETISDALVPLLSKGK